MIYNEYFEIPDQVKDDEEFAAHYDDFPLYQVYVSCLRISGHTRESIMYAPSIWHEANKIIRDVLSSKHIESSYYRLQDRLMRCQYSHDLKILLLLALQLIVYNQHQRSNTEMKKVFGKIIDDTNEKIEPFRRYVTNTYKKDEDGCYIFSIPYTICTELIDYFEKGYKQDNYDYTAIDEEAERIFNTKIREKNIYDRYNELAQNAAALQSKYDAYKIEAEKKISELKKQLALKGDEDSETDMGLRTDAKIIIELLKILCRNNLDIKNAEPHKDVAYLLSTITGYSVKTYTNEVGNNHDFKQPRQVAVIKKINNSLEALDIKDRLKIKES